MPKVSVVIATYNRAPFLRPAIHSVLNQTFEDFELIVVDDGSQDNTAEVVNGFRDNRLRYIPHTVNKGGGAARNTGILNSAGEYIAFLDDDDAWLPEKLEKQVALLDRSPRTVGGVYTGTFNVHKASGRIVSQRLPSKRGHIFQDMLTHNWVRTTTTVVVRKECFDKVGLFDETLTSSQDYDMWIRIAKEYEFECIAEPLAKYYVHDTRISTNHLAIINGMESMLEKYGDLFARSKRDLSRRYRVLGTRYCYINELAKGRAAFFKAIRVCPVEPRNYFNLALSFLGVRNFTHLKKMRKQMARSRKHQVSSLGEMK
jgi:glycosyltransferase involved in cell wall biosynthesis